MKKYSLPTTPRTVVGRKVKHLRSAGQIPATVYGKNVKSVSIAVASDAFASVYKQAGETGLIELTLEKEVRPVLVGSVQVHPVSSLVLHVEFHQVDLKVKVTAKVPVEFVGEAVAVLDKKGVLLAILDEVEVEALPTDLPEKIELNVSTLADIGQELKVQDLKTPSGVSILTDGEQTLVKVGALVSKEAESLVAEEAAKAAAAAAETPAEGAAPASGSTEAKKEATPEGTKEDQSAGKAEKSK